jgi:hypothetical protein
MYVYEDATGPVLAKTRVGASAKALNRVTAGRASDSSD